MILGRSPLGTTPLALSSGSSVAVAIAGVASSTSTGVVAPSLAVLVSGVASSASAGAIAASVRLSVAGVSSATSACVVTPAVAAEPSGAASSTGIGQPTVTAGMDTHDGAVSRQDVDRYLAWRKRREDYEEAARHAEAARIAEENAPPPIELPAPIPFVHPLHRPMTAAEAAREDDDALALMMLLEAA